MASKRCPLCRKISEGHSEACGCGYKFGQNIDETMRLLDDQGRRGTNLAVGGGLSLALGAGVLIAVVALTRGESVVVALLPWILGFIYLRRGLRLLRNARTSKRELEKQRELPSARVVAR